MIEAGYVEDAAAPPPPSLSPAEVDRYDRALTYYAWVDLTPRTSRYDVQAQLKAGKVVVLGLGGPGSAVAASLVAAGVGAVHCADFDVIEAGNLTRQLLYTEDDLGASRSSRASTSKPSRPSPPRSRAATTTAGGRGPRTASPVGEIITGR
jgi:molybdopterin/thiamine biosynthesis adenylyltransferase